MDSPPSPHGAPPSWTCTRAAAPWLAPALAALAGLLGLAWSLTRGLDLTDEGYYLTEIAHPGDTTSTALLYGWVWHPVYAVTGGSVVGLRLVSFALVAVLFFALARAVLSLAPGSARPSRTTVTAVGVVTAGLAFLPLSTLPGTPSYNTLALLAPAAAVLGCAWAWSGRRPVLGGVLVGAAGVVAVLGKPTTALVLGAAVLLTTPYRRTGIRPVLAALGAAVLCLAVLVSAVPGHLEGLVGIVQRGVEATVGHAELVRWDTFIRSGQVMLALALAALGGAASGLVARRSTVAGASLGVVALAVAAASLWRWREVDLLPAIDTTLPSSALAGFGLLGGVAALGALDRRGDAAERSPVRIRLVVLLAVLPAAYAFGTNNNLWYWAGQVTVFWFLAVVLLVGTSGAVAAAAAALAAYTIVVTAVITPLDPYRSEPLTATETAVVSRAGATMRLPPKQAGVTAEMLAVGNRLGVTRETKVLDLTGVSPGVVWAWGVRPLASGWVLGGYPESLHAARTSIEPARCDLARALVLWAPGHRRSIPPNVLEPFGVRLPGDYRVVATFPLLYTETTGPAPRTVQVLEPATVSPTGCRS